MKGFVFKNKTSKYYQASFKEWSAELGEWRRVSKSTKCVDRDRAVEVMEGFVLAARTAAKFPAGTVLTAEYVEGVVIGILAAAGVSIGKVERKQVVIVDYLRQYTDMVTGKVSDNTVRAYRSYETRLIKWFEDVKADGHDLTWLTPSRCEDLYASLLMDMSPKSANERVNYLSRMLDKAKDNDLIQANPMKTVSRTKKGDSLKRLAFTVSEALQLIDWLVKVETEWSRAAMLAMMAGCRLSDAVAMRRTDLKDGVLYYAQSKTGKQVSVPLVIERYRIKLESVEGDLMCPALHEEYEARGTSHMSSVFTDFIERAGIKQEWHTFRKSGRRIARKTFHSLRHTLRTAIVSGGGSDAQADLILGHSPGEGKRYTHIELDALRVALTNALVD